MRALEAALALSLFVRPVPDTARPRMQIVTAASSAALSTAASAATPVPTPVPDTTAGHAAPDQRGKGLGAENGSLDDRRKAIATEMVKLAASLRRSIEAGSVEAILSHIPTTGLRCGDRVVPRARVEHDLRTRGSWLHEVMFGDVGPSPRAPRSLRALFKAVPDTAIVVGFRRDPTAGAVGRPCLDYRAEGFVTPGAPLCFDRRDGAWWLVDSLYPCG